MPVVSVIIPAFNEEGEIGNTIRWLRKFSWMEQSVEIIVVDGGSTDNTTSIARQEGALVISADKGRAKQMNAGAKAAKGTILYFLHADSLPPANFETAITNAVQKGYAAGCFRLRFDVDHWFLKANSWFTRFNINAFRFGDQSLFVLQSVFERAGGFKEEKLLLEDQEIVARLQRHGRFAVLPFAITTSGRKYIVNGIFKTQAVYFLIYMLYRAGVSQQRLLSLYRKLIRQDKL